MGFPHSMIYPLAALQVPAVLTFFAVLLVDVAVIWGAMSVLPVQLSATATATLWGAWLLISVLAVSLTPFLLGWI